MTQFRVVVGDANSLVGEAIRSLLPGSCEVLSRAATGSELLAAVARLEPELCIIDAALPDLSGVEAARLIRRQRPGTAIVLLCSNLDATRVPDLLEASGVAFVHKSVASEELARAVEAVVRGQSYCSGKIARPSRLPVSSCGRRLASQALTERQREILRLVAQGRCNKEIARELDLSVKTVEFHRGRIMDRVGVRTIAELTRAAISIGLITET